MIATIAIIAVFQGYWLNKLYRDEKQGLKKEADVIFRESIYNLQMQNFRNDTFFNEMFPPNKFLIDAMDAMRRSTKGPGGKKMVISMSSSFSRTNDSTKKKDSAVFATRSPDDQIIVRKGEKPGDYSRIIFRSSIGDSLSRKQIDSAYRHDLLKSKIKVAFTIVSKPVTGNPRKFEDSVDKKSMHTNYAIVGLSNPVAYQAQLGSSFNHLLGKITYPILVSLLLITLTTASFIFLYRNLLAQQRLTQIKNDFISNITHELKTPIATVNVAIEALRSFNAMENPARTKEYLDISSAELQRLSLLVDKVLKLSLFENREIELRKEQFDLRQLVDEVAKTMQLQFQKTKAVVKLEAEGSNFMVNADKLHITSVVYNLLDNALKYSPEKPEILVKVTEKRNSVELQVKDNGVGIPAAYRERIFEKFFRVPQGNTHDIKGYGLGLSYVHHVVEKHQGSIEVESNEGQGSSFTISLHKETGE